MEIYLVGGAVRDALLQRPINERDWLVVGATAEEMLKQGFTPVGKDFPVFLHPESKEEYALARAERKVGKGYHGFVFDSDPTVTIEEDLKRRDLTVNAMAQTADGTIIDPFGGRKDLENKLLRHVSDAFAEDPVRILRLGRFAARYAPLGFSVAQETIALIKKMVSDGEVVALVPERVWQEFWRTLQEDGEPQAFFAVLAQGEALPLLFPSLAMLWQQLPQAFFAELAKIIGAEARFLYLMQGFFSQQLPRYFALDGFTAIREKYILPNALQEKVTLLLTFLPELITPVLSLGHAAPWWWGSRALAMPAAASLLKLAKAVDLGRRPERLFSVLNALTAPKATVQATLSFWQQLEKIWHSPDVAALQYQGLSGKALAEAIEQQRLAALESYLPVYKNT
jgi:tRNA nucleotidyltransferase (CCA-adding enzyme)